MPSNTYININYPFRNSNEGFFLDLTSTDKSAIKADLLHLILTAKGQRLYNPDFGTNLLRFIFEPNDSLTFSDIKTEITTVIKRYLPNLQVNDISVTESEDDLHSAVIRLDYTVTEDVFSFTDFVIINI